MDFKSIQALISDDMAQVDQKILAQLNSDVALINQLGFYIVNSGGKRLRPMLAILAARALGYQGDKHTTAAAFIEFIHTATLLHDDVVDESDLRRGNATANALFGNAASVLVGDYIYTRSFQMLQLMNCNDPDTSESSYMQVIYSKTARLFESATQIGAILNQADTDTEKALQDYGRYLGTAFQLIDDVIDYTSKDDEMGKQTGDDLAEGKPTLPLLHAMQHGSDAESAMIRDAIEKGNGRDKLDAILACMDACGSLAYTRERAEQEAEKAVRALDSLSDSPYKQALVALAKLAVDRNT